MKTISNRAEIRNIEFVRVMFPSLGSKKKLKTLTITRLQGLVVGYVDGSHVHMINTWEVHQTNAHGDPHLPNMDGT